MRYNLEFKNYQIKHEWADLVSSMNNLVLLHGNKKLLWDRIVINSLGKYPVD